MTAAPLIDPRPAIEPVLALPCIVMGSAGAVRFVATSEPGRDGSRRGPGTRILLALGDAAVAALLALACFGV